jgi:hypothetical protein
VAVTAEPFAASLYQLVSVVAQPLSYTMKPLFFFFFLQEIMSYIKGSAEAVACPSGVLGLEQYLALGAKRASNYSRETRKHVHALLPVSMQHSSKLQAVAVAAYDEAAAEHACGAAVGLS